MTRCAHGHLHDSCMTRGLGASRPVQCPLVQHSLLKALHTDREPCTILWSALWLCMWYGVALRALVLTVHACADHCSACG